MRPPQPLARGLFVNGTTAEGTHAAWNVSCDQRPSASANEKTCVARPVHVRSRRPRAYKLPFERYEPPTTRAVLQRYEEEMQWCEGRKRARLSQ